MNIRKFKEKDIENCRKICIETSSLKLKTDNDVKKLHLLYLDYYLNEEPQNCFVATDENDNCVGYILCAIDFDKYKEVFKKKYLPEVKKVSPLYYVLRQLEFIVDSNVKKDYPAHLHIDIFASHQKIGLGHKLVDALVANLKENNVKGVFLRCGKTNEKGINFYKKYGFKLLSTKISALFVLNTL